MPRHQFSLSVLLFLDDKKWIAHCLEYDIVAQGKTIQSAKESFEKTFVGQVVLDIINKRSPLEGISQSPKEIWDMFKDGIKVEEIGSLYVPQEKSSLVSARFQDVRIAA